MNMTEEREVSEMWCPMARVASTDSEDKSANYNRLTSGSMANIPISTCCIGRRCMVFVLNRNGTCRCGLVKI